MPPSSGKERAPHAEKRMTIGEHLDDLRGCLARSLLAFVLACLACIWPAKYLLGLIARPVVMALRKHGQPDSFLATSPVEAILIYVKVVVFAGLVISAPYIIMQIWTFVAVGLYGNEKKWVYKLVPASVGLFVTGVVFMYLFALVLTLNFLVGFSNWLPLPQAQPTRLEGILLGGADVDLPSTQPAIHDGPIARALEEDPNDPPVGLIWFNLLDRKLKYKGTDETYSVQFQRDDRRALVTTHFRIGEYLTFVLVLTIAFGLAFQMPLVVIFLVRSGLVSIQTLRGYRKVVYLVVVIIAGVIAPPDLLSHVLLSGPMVLLFEIGLLFAGSRAKPETAEGQS